MSILKRFESYLLTTRVYVVLFIITASLFQAKTRINYWHVHAVQRAPHHLIPATSPSSIVERKLKTSWVPASWVIPTRRSWRGENFAQTHTAAKVKTYNIIIDSPVVWHWRSCRSGYRKLEICGTAAWGGRPPFASTRPRLTSFLQSATNSTSTLTCATVFYIYAKKRCEWNGPFFSMDQIGALRGGKTRGVGEGRPEAPTRRLCFCSR